MIQTINDLKEYLQADGQFYQTQSGETVRKL